MITTRHTDASYSGSTRKAPLKNSDAGPDKPVKPRVIAVEAAVFPDLAPGTAGAPDNDIRFVDDVQLVIVAEVGRTTITLGRLMELKAGQIIALDKTAGEPSELFVNGHAIAKAEVLVLDDNFGLRIQEIVPAAERIRQR